MEAAHRWVDGGEDWDNQKQENVGFHYDLDYYGNRPVVEV